MNPIKILTAALSLAAGAMLSLTVSAQTLTFTNGIQVYGALANTTVTMTGHCELWVTNSTAPLTGCTINLNSVDAWLFVPNVLPSVVASTYLGQVRVNGASAVVDSNVRVVQYAMGAVVIPHSSSFQPMQVFNGAQFTGASLQLSQYTLYTGTALGALDRAISSFRLKRGYMAVVAQNVNGTGASRCYVAQDGDLEVSVLPSALDNQIRFIRVLPWRWTSKKGIAGDPGIGLLNVRWWYDWNIDQTSSRDLEYVAIRQTQYWPGLGQNWQSLGVNTVLGYNEPDQANQANMTVAAAISSWPDLLGTGLRVGAPAVSDGGRSSWLYPFMTQANAAGLRVDFVPVHYYQWHNPADPNGAASQMYSFLLDIWNHTHLPVWVTEWNNGANWTDGTGTPAPTYAQQQACIAAMTAMLDSTPFVERYALYNWVEDVRSVVNSNGVTTAAGVTYSNEVSPTSYVQTTPDVGSRGIAQLRFETNTLDSSGYGNNGFAFGSPGYTTGHQGQAIMLNGINNFIQLPTTVAQSNAFSFAAWVNWNGGANWQRIFDFGDDTSHYLFLTPSSGGGTLRFAINNGGGEQILETSALPVGTWQHVAVTLSGGSAKLYVNGALAASSSAFTNAPSSFDPNLNYLGKSQFSADPLFQGSLDEVQIADYAFTAAQVASLVTNSPPQFTTNLIDRGTAAPFVVFNGTISGTATDPDPGDTLTYSIANGPAWLTLNPDGTFTGTPGASDGGTNYFTVRASDSAGASAFAVLSIYVPITYTNGVWSTDADGDWNDITKWSNGAVANGAAYTADFSTLSISADRTVMLDQPRSIGTLKFGDTSNAHNWTLGSYGDPLTLDSGSSSAPSVVVNQNTATIAASLISVYGLAKSGPGTLILSNANALSGTLYIDTQSTTTPEGSVRLAFPGAFGSVTNIQIRDNNHGNSTLQLDGSVSNLATAASIALNGRLDNVVAVQNLSGTNTISGGVTVSVGGSYYVFQSDSGLLNLGGTITSAASGTRTFTFQGNGDFYVSGSIQNGSSTNNFIKTGSGNLTLGGANTFTGTNRITAGKVTLDNSAALQTSTLDMNAADAGTLSFGVLTNAALGGLMGSRNIALTNTAGVPPTLSVGTNNLAQTYSGIFSGSGSLIKTGTNTFTLSNAGTFTGTTRVNAGILTLANSSALQNSTLDMNAADAGALSFGALTSATLGGLAGSRNLALTNNSNAAVALTVGGNGQTSTFAGVLFGPGSLNKTGSGSLTLSSSNNYAGNTTVSAGTLKLSRDPVIKLSFDNVSGPVNGSIITNDGSGGAVMNGVITGNGANVVAGGRFGNALSINGAGGTAKTNIVLISNRGVNTDAAGNWTVAFWIKTTTAGAVILYQGDGTWSSSGQTAFLLNANSGTTAGTKAGAVRWAGGFLTGTAALNNGNWHFVTLVDNAGTESIYVDGNLDTVTSSMSLPLASGANQTWIGGSPDTDTGAVKINGLIDEVSMFSRPLSVTEVRSLTNTLPALTPGNFGGQLPSTTALAVSSGATFDLGGNSQTIASLADNSGGGTVTNSGAAPVTLTLGSGSGTKTFSGIIADSDATNAISLVKNGAATEILAGANMFRGTTTINSGLLTINGSLGTNAVTVNGGTLGGNGVIGGAVTIQSGGTLSPGNSTGLLTINNTLTLNGTTLIELNKAVPTNDVIQGMSSVNYGGTLTVTNLGGTLAAGDSFAIFSATNYNGSFATLNLPLLGVGLAWNTNSLTNGVLSIVATQPPQFGAITQTSDGNFQFNGTGSAGVNYELDGATNLLPPVAWSYVTNAVADQNGLFQFSDLQATNFPQRFYRILSGQ